MFTRVLKWKDSVKNTFFFCSNVMRNGQCDYFKSVGLFQFFLKN